MQRHTWRERSEDGLRFFRASHHSGTWTLQSQLKGEEDWAAHDPISEEEWRALRDVLWRKYQRGRGPWEFIEKIDKHLAELEEGEGRAGDSSPPDGLRRDKRAETDSSTSRPSDHPGE